MTGNFQAWVGREQQHTERILVSVVETLAATLDLDRAPHAGEPLPPGWQWVFFNSATRRGELGSDGHPKRGGFLPPIELPRRMWAGSRIRYVADLPIGAEATRRSRILKVANKVGQSGSLWFVTVEHTITCEGQVCIAEERDIVYREAARPASGSPRAQERHPVEAQWTRAVEPDTVLLFRYSALTFNGHRIHYDQSYARNEEGYRDLVVHGPLTATLLQQFALERGAGRALGRFDFRGVSPLCVDRGFHLEGRAAESGALDLWARGPDGELAMSATATFR